MSQKNAKQYSQDDITQFRSQLESLPDVTNERLQKKDVLLSLKDDINTLISSKGYTLNEVHDHLKKFGFEDVTLKDLKEISLGKKPRRSRAGTSKKSDHSQQNASGVTQHSTDTAA